jgi:predicted nucleic acid-binding Zn ribbon protein
MPVYRYKHDCGRENDIFLKADKETLQVSCDRCLRVVTARQVRDKSIIVKEKDGTTGLLRRNA